MLLQFKVKNYKSFKEETVLSMIPAPKQKDLEYSLINKRLGSNEYKAIPTAVLYGPNASGKTNIIGAIETLVAIINRGHIKNDVSRLSDNTATNFLEFIPNKDYKMAKPVYFYISFICDNKHIEFTLELDLGVFLDRAHDRKILFEELKVDGLVIYSFKDRNISAGLSRIDGKIVEALTSNLEKEEVFLSNGFKNVVDNKLANSIIDYLNKNLIIMYRFDAKQVTTTNKDKKALKDEQLSLIAAKIGAYGTDIGFYARDQESPLELTTFLEVEKEGGSILVPSKMYESYGTIRFLTLYPLIKHALLSGSVLIIDEFDASLHPMLLIDIINLFHNDEININGAQLIFNTHNPIFLSSSILRRDEIKFVDKDEDGSTIFQLSDFKTSGKDGVRVSDDYMKHYFINKYGGIIDIDLSDHFRGIVNEKN